MATLLMAAGTPMITAGDEIGRTQRGNNNAYCQDSPISWIDWELSEWRRDLLATTRYLLLLRRENAALRAIVVLPRPSRRRRAADPDLAWFGADADTLDHDDWHDPAVRDAADAPLGRAARRALLVVNGALDPVPVVLADERPDAVGARLGQRLGAPGRALVGGHRRRTAPGLPGDTVVMEPLSIRLYLERTPTPVQPSRTTQPARTAQTS